MSRYLGSTVWEMALITQILQLQKLFKQKRLGDIESARKYLFLEEFKQKQKIMY